MFQHGQVIQMLNNPSVVANIKSDEARIGRWLGERKTTSRIVELIYLTTLSRRPTDSERALIRRHLRSMDNERSGLFDLQFALLNSNEFLLRH